MRIKTDPGSFKDPAGGVFYYADKVYRSVTYEFGQFYQGLVQSDFFQELIRSKYFIPTWPVDLSHDLFLTEKFGSETIYFEHEPIEFLTFPYEWPASMIVDAGILTLDLQTMLLQKNLSLKDATPYNIQFCYTQPLFIDLCSVIDASKNGIWIAYNQFCQTFLYPLLMFQLGAFRLNAIYLSHMDGLTLDETVRSLGFRPFLKHGLTIDYLIPALITKLKHLKVMDITKKSVSTSRTLSNSAEIQLHTVRRLRKWLNKMRPKKATSDWVNYMESCSYGDEEYRIKKQFIEDSLQKHHVEMILDLGCNIGDFSIIAAKHGHKVVALDSDYDCIDYLYDTSKANNYPILPLHMDISNPCPSIGWFNEERSSFLNRINGRFDCVFALALIHHLMITNRIPLIEIVRFFHYCTSRFLIIEYIGTSDMKFQELLKYRTETYNDFNMDDFEKVMSSKFALIRKEEMFYRERGMERCLYLMEKY
jgi:SAM-dependent methyltransferase